MMKKIIGTTILSLLLLCGNAFGQQGGFFNPISGKMDGCLWIEEIDTFPANAICGKLKVSNDALADNGDGTYTLTTGVGGGGDVSGPGSAVDNAIVRFDGTSGKIIQAYTSGSPTISDTGVATFALDPIVPDEVYGAGWNGSLEPPTKNAVYDELQSFTPTEVNNLETDDPPNVANTEVYIGTGAGTGAWSALSGEATMANNGAVTLADSVTVNNWALGTIASGVGTALTALNGENIQDDTIDEDSIDFGTSTDQISAVDIPIADTGGFFEGTEVEAALQEAGFLLTDITDDIALNKYVVTHAVDGSGVWTITITQPGGLDLEFNIALTHLQDDDDTMSVVATAFVGTNAVPKTVYVYVDDNAGSPRLVASNTNPEGVVEHVDVARYRAGAITAGSPGSVNIYGGVATAMTGYEILSKLYHRVFAQGSLYLAGLGTTATTTNVTIATGTVQTLFDLMTTTERIVGTHGFFHIDSAGEYEEKTDFSFTEYSTGESIGANKFYNVVLGVLEDDVTRIMALVQGGSIAEPLGKEYKNAKECIEDKYGELILTPSDDLLKVLFVPVARICIENDGSDELQEIPEPGTGVYYVDLRGQLGGGGGSVSTAGSPTDADYLVGTANADLSAEEVVTANGLALVKAADYAAMRTLLNLEQGTDFYSKSAEDTWRSSVTQTEMSYLNGAASDIQTQLNTIPTVSDTAYNATSWNTNTDAATKNAIRDKIETLGSGNKQVCFIIDGGGSAITTGAKAWVRAANSFTIGNMDITADQSGSIVVDLWLEQYADFPPVNADSICDSGTCPTLSTAQKGTDSTLTSWVTTVTAGDYIRANVDSATTVEMVEVCIYE